MRIGQLAAQTGVTVQTIRFYERRGLLKKTARLASGYRYYAQPVCRVLEQLEYGVEQTRKEKPAIVDG